MYTITSLPYSSPHWGKPNSRSAALPASRIVCEPSNQSPMETQLATTHSCLRFDTVSHTLTSWQVACWPACPEVPFRDLLIAVVAVTKLLCLLLLSDFEPGKSICM